MFKRCGTPGFVAPELLQDKIYDYKIDIFSVGVLMFIMYLFKYNIIGYLVFLHLNQIHTMK